MAKNSLKPYQERRSFDITSEPRGSKKKSKNQPIFVIQKHDASHLHFDLRLEIGGVLVSWAIPKGPSLNPADKRLAVRTEDHPYDYAHFEGTIPQGEYGGGTVMVWDYGTYENLKKHNGKALSMKQCLDQGHIEVFLHGKKLTGAFSLVRMHMPGKEQWLCIKMHDEYASARKNPVKTHNKSALSGKTMRQIAQGADQASVGKKSKKKTR